MTKANDEWEYRGQNLSRTGWAVRALGAPEQVPTRRGKNLVIPGKTGRYRTTNKKLDERRLTLAMFVDAKPATGGVRSGTQLWANLDMLKKLFAEDGLGTLKHQNAEGTTRLASAEVVGTVEFEPGGPWHYGFAVEFAFADPFWYAESGVSVGPTNISSSPQNITVTNDGTYKSEKGIFTIVGQIVDPKLQIGDYWMQYGGTVAAGGTLVIDVNAFTAMLGTADHTGEISHDGGLVWLPVPCGGSCTMTVTGSGISGATVKVEFTEPFI